MLTSVSCMHHVSMEERVPTLLEVISVSALNNGRGRTAI